MQKLGICLSIMILAQLIFMTNVDASNNRHAIIIGGSCEEKPEKNIFHENMSKQIRLLSQRGWNVISHFNGNLARCQTLEKNKQCASSNPPARCCPKDYQAKNWHVSKMPGTQKRNSKKAIFDSLDQMINKFESGRIPKGAQVFFSINTHGDIQNGKHKICLNDDYWLDLDDPVLQSKFQRLKDLGAKMGFSSVACYGGHTITSLSKFGCVITSTTGEQVAGGFGINASLVSLLENQKNFRQADIDRDFTVSMDELYLFNLFHDSIRYKRPNEFVSQQAQLSGAQAVGIDQLIANSMTRITPKNQDNNWFFSDQQLSNREKCEVLGATTQGLDQIINGLGKIDQAVQSDILQRRLSSIAGQDLDSIGSVTRFLKKKREDILRYRTQFQWALEDETKFLAKLNKIFIRLELPLPDSININDPEVIEKLRVIMRNSAVWDGIPDSSIFFDPKSKSIRFQITGIDAQGLKIYSDPETSSPQRLETLLMKRFPSDFSAHKKGDFYKEYELKLKEFKKNNVETIKNLKKAQEYLGKYTNNAWIGIDRAVTIARAYLYAHFKNKLKWSKPGNSEKERNARKSIKECDRFIF